MPIVKGNFTLYTREEFKAYLAALKVTRVINIIQNHHTFLPDYRNFTGKNHFIMLEGMRTFHMRDRGFSEVAQNLTTFNDGTIALSKGRGINEIPAGIKGANSHGICIEHVGNFDLKGNKLTLEHNKTILFLNAVLCNKFKLTIDTNHITYHHWWDLNTGKRVPDERINTNHLEGYSTKSCPGTNFYGGNTVDACKKNFLPLVQGYKL